MYQAYWGLSGSPFRGHLDARLFYQAPTQEEALARLHFLVDERRALGLLLGESGTGKSLVLEVFARQLGRVARQPALVNLAGLGAHEFLWFLADQLGAEVAPAATEFKLVRAVNDWIAANRYQQISTILLLDDADEARQEVIDQILRLAQLDASRDPRLTIVLAAQSRRLHKLGNRLLELAELRIDLDAWELDDTAAFVKQSLAHAGRSTPVFTDAGLGRLHELAAGIPRRVKQLADLALVAGAGQNLVHVEAETVESVFQELGVVATADLRAVHSR